MSRVVFQRSVTLYVSSHTGTLEDGKRTDCLPSDAADTSSWLDDLFCPLVSVDPLVLEVSSTMVLGLERLPRVDVTEAYDLEGVTFLAVFGERFPSDHGLESDWELEKSVQFIFLVSTKIAEGECFERKGCDLVTAQACSLTGISSL